MYTCVCMRVFDICDFKLFGQILGSTKSFICQHCILPVLMLEALKQGDLGDRQC